MDKIYKIYFTDMAQILSVDKWLFGVVGMKLASLSVTRKIIGLYVKIRKREALFKGAAGPQVAKGEKNKLA